MGLFIKKPLADLMTEANDSGSKSLKRILGPWSLIALGVGVIIGAGLFSITGAVAAGYTGPAITLSFAIAALGCCFAGLCYAEFASMIPVAGSAYTYSYATMGELVAWIIGWDLVLEYCVAATTVSISWSRYLVVFLEGFGVHLPQALTACPWDGGIVNIPAFVIVVLMSILLIRGTEGSSIFNGIIVFLKVSVVLVFVVLGWKYIRMENYTPYIPTNTGTLGEFGFSGILRGAAIVFFAFLGFDAVSTAAQETKNPKRDMPIGILMSLVVCTILYMLFAHVMTGVVHYSAFAGQNGIAPVAIAIDHMGQMDASGVNKKLEQAPQKLEDALKVMRVLSTVAGTSALQPATALKSSLLPFKDAKADGTYYADIADALNAGNTAPFIYSGWENTIVTTGLKMLDFMKGNATMEDVVRQLDEDQDSVVNNTPDTITTVTEELSQEDCAMLVGRCFAQATGSDLALVSLSTWIPGNPTDQNHHGVAAKLYAKGITDYDLSVILPTGWNRTIQTVTLTGQQINDLLATGYDAYGNGKGYPYVLVSPVQPDAGKTYQVAICGVSDQLAAETTVTDSGVVGMDAAKAFFGAYTTISRADTAWS